MPPPKREISELGFVVNHAGRHRAEIYVEKTHIRGPPRENKKHAFEDLSAIQAAAAEESTMMGVVLAMKREANRLKACAKAEVEVGGVQDIRDEHWARIQ